jgi:large subunit ribosomal protein L21
MNYAIIDLGGAQRRVSPGETINVERLASDKAVEGKSYTFDRVLMIRSDKGLKIGAPLVEGATIKATVLGQALGSKLTVFKRKRRKQYRRTRGHRAQYTTLRIDKIQPGK